MHIVNVIRIRGYNLKLGYPIIDIRSPKEIIYNETTMLKLRISTQRNEYPTAELILELMGVPSGN